MNVTVALYGSGSYTELVDNQLLNSVFLNLLKTETSDLLIRLYRKYVKREQVSSTIYLLESKLILLKNREQKILNHLIDACKYASEVSELSYQTFDIYRPLRLVILDEPYCTLSDDIPLEDYDNNEGEPFWMRPQYIIENYSQMYKKEKEKNNK